MAMIGLLSVTFTRCKEEGCDDPKADNYNPDADDVFGCRRQLDRYHYTH